MAFSQVTKDEAWDRDNKGTKAICPACKKHEIHINTAEYDHIKSLKNGGSNDVSNCKAICATCNREKGRMDIEEYMKKFYPNEFQLNEKAIEEIKYEILEHENSIKELKIQKDILENKIKKEHLINYLKHSYKIYK